MFKDFTKPWFAKGLKENKQISIKSSVQSPIT
jgi:hypothetical protein